MAPVIADEQDTIPTDDDALMQALRAEATAPRAEVADWAGATSRGHVRRRNEDAWGEAAGRLFVIADGMGGYDGGDLAAQTAVRSLLSTASSRGIADWPATIGRLNAQVQTATRARGFDRAGTTLVAVTIIDGVAVVVHVGDSRAYRLRHGRIIALTSDHTVANELEASGIDLRQHPRRARSMNALTRHLGGADEQVVPDIVSIVPFVDDRLILMSDGIHRQLNDATIAAAASHPSCAEAANQLVIAADNAGGKDNATAVVVALRAGSNPAGDA